jgi:hypothetical protein
MNFVRKTVTILLLYSLAQPYTDATGILRHRHTTSWVLRHGPTTSQTDKVIHLY